MSANPRIVQSAKPLTSCPREKRRGRSPWKSPVVSPVALIQFWSFFCSPPPIPPLPFEVSRSENHRGGYKPEQKLDTNIVSQTLGQSRSQGLFECTGNEVDAEPNGKTVEIQSSSSGSSLPHLSRGTGKEPGGEVGGIQSPRQGYL